MDKYDLYGKMAIPKKNTTLNTKSRNCIAIAAEKAWRVFVNFALTEPFGITLIEAAACGLPIIAPNDGGPLDTIMNCQCGLLVDTTNTEEIAAAVQADHRPTEKKWKTVFRKRGS